MRSNPTLVVVNGKAAQSDGKTDNAIRPIALDDLTAKALGEWKQRQDEEKAFFGRDYPTTDAMSTPTPSGTASTGSQNELGSPALKAGINPKIVSARLGHASVGFTLDVYLHALPGMDRDAAHTIAAMFTDDEDHVSKSVSKA